MLHVGFSYSTALAVTDKWLSQIPKTGQISKFVVSQTLVFIDYGQTSRSDTSHYSYTPLAVLCLWVFIRPSFNQMCYWICWVLISFFHPEWLKKIKKNSGSLRFSEVWQFFASRLKQPWRSGVFWCETRFWVSTCSKQLWKVSISEDLKVFRFSAIMF